MSTFTVLLEGTWRKLETNAGTGKQSSHFFSYVLSFSPFSPWRCPQMEHCISFPCFTKMTDSGGSHTCTAVTPHTFTSTLTQCGVPQTNRSGLTLQCSVASVCRNETADWCVWIDTTEGSTNDVFHNHRPGWSGVSSHRCLSEAPGRGNLWCTIWCQHVDVVLRLHN